MARKYLTFFAALQALSSTRVEAAIFSVVLMMMLIFPFQGAGAGMEWSIPKFRLQFPKPRKVGVVAPPLRTIAIGDPYPL